MNEAKQISPLFITGLWRSGTTLISRIMNNHEDFHITYDTVHFMRFSYNHYDPIENIKNAKKLIVDTSNRLKERYQLELSPTDVMEALDGKYSYSNIYDEIMKNLFLQGKSQHQWGEKTNVAWTKIPDFFDLYPNGRVIHIIRDPRAVLYSWKKFTHAPGNIYLDSIQNSYDALSKAIEHNHLFASKRYVTIVYEELVTAPKETILKACEKLDIEYTDSMLDQSGFTDMHGASWKSNSIHDCDSKGIYTDVLDKWKDGLSDWEIALGELFTNDLLSEFGYKKYCSEWSREIVDHAISEALKSNFVSSGLLHLLLTNESFERYPSDPTDKNNW